MDAKRMNQLLFDGLPVVARPIVLAAHLGAGAGVGALFFHGLWWNVRLIVEGARVSTSVALLAGRFLLIGALLALAALEGASPLLVAAFGVFIGRFFVLRAIGNGER
jgi:F1F0 ATPase subunit 2